MQSTRAPVGVVSHRLHDCVIRKASQYSTSVHMSQDLLPQRTIGRSGRGQPELASLARLWSRTARQSSRTTETLCFQAISAPGTSQTKLLPEYLIEDHGRGRRSIFARFPLRQQIHLKISGGAMSRNPRGVRWPHPLSAAIARSVSNADAAIRSPQAT